MRRLLGAFQFLTVIPIRGSTAPPWQCAAFFPIVGAALGAAGALILMASKPFWPVQVRTLLVVAFWVLITGALHEDGLADVADAFRAGRPREEILAIMKDSRIGVFGGLALVLSVVWRWQTLTAMRPDTLPALTAALALSRASIVVLARLSSPAAEGMGSAVAARVSAGAAAIAGLQGAVAGLLCGPVAAAALTGTAAVVVLAARWFFHRHIGGVTGDCLGAGSQAVEMALLGVLACRSCMW